MYIWFIRLNQNTCVMQTVQIIWKLQITFSATYFTVESTHFRYFKKGRVLVEWSRWTRCSLQCDKVRNKRLLDIMTNGMLDRPSWTHYTLMQPRYSDVYLSHSMTDLLVTWTPYRISKDWTISCPSSHNFRTKYSFYQSFLDYSLLRLFNDIFHMRWFQNVEVKANCSWWTRMVLRGGGRDERRMEGRGGIMPF